MNSVGVRIGSLNKRHMEMTEKNHTIARRDVCQHVLAFAGVRNMI